MVINGYQSVIIGYQRLPRVMNCYQWLLVNKLSLVINGYQELLIVVNGY